MSATCNTRRAVPWLLFVLGLGLLASSPAIGGNVDGRLYGDYASGLYGQAREDLDAAFGDDAQAGTRLLRLLLTPDPDRATALLADDRESEAEGDGAWKLRAALERADLAFARKDFSGALEALDSALEGNDQEAPGIVHLRAGLAWRGLGRLQEARERLATVRPEDPAFVEARYFLGDIALEQGDPELGLHYFDGALESASGAGQRAALQRARARALAVMGREAEARALLAGLPATGLSALGAATAPPPPVPAAADTVPAASTTHTGRFRLQWAAFRDRSLALTFQRDHRDQAPDMTIEPGTDGRGLPIYRVRSGSFADPQAARRKATQLSAATGIDIIVVKDQ